MSIEKIVEQAFQDRYLTQAMKEEWQLGAIAVTGDAAEFLKVTPIF
ncbi:hypothetical protein [Nostoc sp.]